MQNYFQEMKAVFRKGDMVLLLLCLITTAFGCLIISSATNYMDSLRFIIMQIVAALLGVVLFALVSSIDAEWFSEHRTARKKIVKGISYYNAEQYFDITGD